MKHFLSTGVYSFVFLVCNLLYITFLPFTLVWVCIRSAWQTAEHTSMYIAISSKAVIIEEELDEKMD